MAGFSPRNGKSDYIKSRGKHFYYRRSIPPVFRSRFDGKTEWNIRLNAATEAGRRVEAGALAHQHNQLMLGDFDKFAVVEQSTVDDTLSLKLDVSPENFPIGNHPPPFQFYRDGKLIKTCKAAGSNDPEFLRKAEAEGYFVMTRSEWMQQAKLMNLRKSLKGAETPDAQELAKLRIRDVR